MSQSTYNSQVPTYKDYTRLAFVKAVLARAGWPDTASNEQFLLNIAQREGTSAAFNPFATTQPEPGASDFNSVHVRNYTSFESGVDATVRTLRNGLYGDITAALASGNAAAQDAAGRLSHGLSTWSGGGYTTVANMGGKDRPLSTSGGGNGAGGPNAPGGASPDNVDIDGFLKSQAPKLAAVLGSDPQVSSLLNQWANNQLSDAEFQNQLEATAWWKKTPASRRQEYVLEATDPGTAAQKLDQTYRQVLDLAAQMGVGIPSKDAQAIAGHVISDGWSNAQVRERLAGYGKYQGDITYKGEAAVDVQQLKALYKSYALPTSAPTLNAQLQLLLSGKQTIDDFKQGLAEKAKGLFHNPNLDAALDAGQTVDQAMGTYRDIAVNTLGVDPNSVDWTDPKWGVALTGTRDADGNYQVMSPFDWQKTLETNPVYGYDESPRGIQQGADIAQTLGHVFSGGAGF